MKKKSLFKKIPWKMILALIVVITAFTVGGVLIWVSTFKIPDLATLRAQALVESTKIYDRTGNTLLYDLNPNIKRTVVPFDQISQHVKDATLAIEDASFYSHAGIRPLAIIRAAIVNLFSGSFKEGGSTITQQVVKNSLLSSDKTISRKIKEWVLSIRLEQIADKDTILNLYLNSNSYGGNHFGIEEASEAFLGKHAADLDIAESAYLAAIPQAPTHYSPYGKYKQDLENRKNLVLRKMLDNKFISKTEYDQAMAEKVTFQSGGNQGIKAPHFVMFIKAYLENKYGVDKVESGGLKVITTLDYTMQQKGEELAKKYALQNEVNFNASNDALVALDPKTGQILTMVGSRDYFDNKIDGNFNVVTAPNRQPGSTFKPFVYAESFNEGYTQDTLMFDAKIQFSTACPPDNLTSVAPCYSPNDFSGTFQGPITVRNALAGSVNVPAVEMLYMVGVRKALELSKAMGITTLTDPNQYGLTLVLGGGEVSPIDMTDAYAVFATGGIRNPYTGILSVQDNDGTILEQYTQNSTQVLPEQTALQISDILNDNVARSSEYGLDSPLYFPGKDVAAKTGTTNNFVDAWIIGYTPNIVVTAWAGNNNGTPMAKKIAGFIVAPFWRAFMDSILPSLPDEQFKAPDPVDQTIKPILRGIWPSTQGYFYSSSTPLVFGQTQNLVYQTNIPEQHSLLYYVDRKDPLGPAPVHPENDAQFANWEYGVRNWFTTNGAISPTVNFATSTPATAPIN
jgi:1A family penicillin-binding protein